MCCHTCWHHVRVFDLDYTSNQKYIHELGWWVGGWVGGWVGKGGAVRGRGRGQKHKHTIQTRQLNNMQQENIKLYKFFLKYLGLSDRVWCAVKYEQYSAKI